jgi:hypothetical protein
MAMARTSRRPRGSTVIHCSSIEQAALLHLAQVGELGGEVGLEVDQVGDLDRLDRQFEVAHQRLDDAAAQQIVGVQLDAAVDRQHVPLSRLS